MPLLRELVFDIDMTDYDEIRTCCMDKKICKRCWGFIAAAVQILDSALRGMSRPSVSKTSLTLARTDQFGFKHLLWVYSGRRGIHCWVSDVQAMSLTDDARRTLVNYLEVIKGGKDMAKKVNVRVHGKPLHPFLQECIDTLGFAFEDVVLEDQDAWREENKWEVVLQILPDKGESYQVLSVFCRGSHIFTRRCGLVTEYMGERFHPTVERQIPGH